MLNPGGCCQSGFVANKLADEHSAPWPWKSGASTCVSRPGRCPPHDKPSHQPLMRLSGSAFDLVIAHGPPALNEVAFLSAASGLPGGIVMGVKMRGAIGDGVFQLHVTFKPLMQIPGLRNVDRRPITILQLPGINVIAGQWPEGSGQRENIVMIFFAGLPGPVVGGGWCSLGMRVTTE